MSVLLTLNFESSGNRSLSVPQSIPLFTTIISERIRISVKSRDMLGVLIFITKKQGNHEDYI